MNNKLNEKCFDVRVVSRYLLKGLINEKDVQDFNKSLPDDEKNFELTIINTDRVGVDAQTMEVDSDSEKIFAPTY